MENFCKKNRAVIAITFIRWLKEQRVYGIFCKTYRHARWSNANACNPTLALDDCHNIYKAIIKIQKINDAKVRHLVDQMICYRDSEKKGCLTERQLIHLNGRWIDFFDKFKQLITK